MRRNPLYGWFLLAIAIATFIAVPTAHVKGWQALVLGFTTAALFFESFRWITGKNRTI